DPLVDGGVVLVPGGRSEDVLAMVAAHASDNFPSLAGMILNGGFLPSEQVSRLVAGLPQPLPMVATTLGTFETTRRVAETRGLLSTGSQRKLDTARATFTTHVDGAALLKAVALPRSDVVTPMMFEYDVIGRARADRKHVVLPEGGDDRILRAASTLLARGVAALTSLGD